MADQSIIIVGAGASGLMAAHMLSAQGFKVTILEARDRIGGRIHTVTDALTGMPMEFGAEFVHGDLELTSELIKKAHMAHHEVKGEMWDIAATEPQNHGHVINHWKEFEDELGKLDTDKSINQFLEEKFSGPEYVSLRASVLRYAAGYDTADPRYASTMALASEWLEQEHSSQYRLDNGYTQLLDYLLDSSIKHDAAIHTDSVVKNVQWQPGKVTVTTADGREYKAGKVLITIPVSLLRAPHSSPASINFAPEIPQVAAAARQVALGAVVKVLLFFNEPFWLTEEIKERLNKDMKKVSFIFSYETVPTWWTQNPNNLPLLAGWIGGPPAEAMKDKSDEEIKALALQSLANIFQVPVPRLKSLLRKCHIANWTADPYTMGSYSYTTVGCEPSRHTLNTPVEDTLYFAGEALYSGPAMGTVEAAFASGKDAAERILNSA
jgi:monoamine oxidase